jgi:predicted DNA-binding transcriptional regulator AlpA
MTGKSDQWVYQKTTKNAKDPLPFQKFGRELVFSRKAIQEYIDNHTKSILSPESIMTARLQESAKKKLR